MRHQFICNADTAVVSTGQGKVRGYIYDQVYTFKGVPYAQAERFHKPEPVTPWKGVKDCTSYGFVCPLADMGKPNGELAVPHRYWPMNEHCQNLNIFTPGLDDRKRPVMVWLHGGGFEAGSSIEQQVYEGGNMALLGDLVVVSINHRLNILGYFDMSDFGEEYENSGNAGTADIIAALQWIHDNIAAFGGDPENVTVFGQSGGGAKVSTLLQSPEADGLYAKGFNMSGVTGPILPDCVGSGKELAEAVMKELGISTAKELETVDYSLFSKAYQKIKPAFVKAGKYAGGKPQVNAHYAGEPSINGFRQETKDIPLLIGSVFGEFLAFGPAMVNPDASEEEVKAFLSPMVGKEASDLLMEDFKEAYPERKPSSLLTLDCLFRGPEIIYNKKRTALNNCTWIYLFNQDFEMEGGKTPWHCSDIPYVFHNCEMAPATQQDGVEELEERIFATVMAFAKTSNPNNDKIPQWDPSTPEEEKVLLISNETRVAVNHDQKLIADYSKYMGPVLMAAMGRMMDNVQH